MPFPVRQVPGYILQMHLPVCEADFGTVGILGDSQSAFEHLDVVIFSVLIANRK